MKKSKQNVGVYKKVSKSGILSIIVAEKKINEGYVYVPKYKIADEEAVIVAHLKEKYPDSVDEDLAGSYSKKSLKKKEVKKMFEKEIKEAIEHKQKEKEAREASESLSLDMLSGFLKDCRELKKKEESEGGEKIDKKDKKPKKPSLKDQAKELKGKKVFNVTKMTKKSDPEVITYFKKLGLRRLSQVEGNTFYSIVYDPAVKSSPNGVRNFMTRYGCSDDEIEKTVKGVTDGNIINLGRSKSPTRAPLFSPKRKKKQAVE